MAFLGRLEAEVFESRALTRLYYSTNISREQIDDASMEEEDGSNE